MAGRVEGKVALVTGAARGTGEQTARLLVEEGAQVVLADVQEDLGQGQVVLDHHPGGGDVLDALLDAPLLLAELEDRAHVVVAGEDGGGDDRLLDGLDAPRRRQPALPAASSTTRTLEESRAEATEADFTCSSIIS